MTTTTATARTITRALRSIWPAGVRVSTKVDDTTIVITAPDNLHGASGHEHIRRTVIEATGQLWVFNRLEPIAARGNGRFARYHLNRPERPLRAEIVAVEWYDAQDNEIRRGEVIDSNTTSITVRWPNGRDEKISRRDFRDDQRFVRATDADAIPAPRTPAERAAADEAWDVAHREVFEAGYPFLDRPTERQQIEESLGNQQRPRLLDSDGRRTPQWCRAVTAALTARAAEIDAAVAAFKVGDEVTHAEDQEKVVWSIREIRTDRHGDVWISLLRTLDDGTKEGSGGRARGYDLHRAATGLTYLNNGRISDQALQDLWLLYAAGYLRDGDSYQGRTLNGGAALEELQIAGYVLNNLRPTSTIPPTPGHWEITEAGAAEVHRLDRTVELARAYHRTDTGDVTVVILLDNNVVETHNQYCDRPAPHVTRTLYPTFDEAETAYNRAVNLFRPVPAQVDSAVPMDGVVAMAAGTNELGQHHIVTQLADHRVQVDVYSVAGTLVSATEQRFETGEEAGLRYLAEVNGNNPLAGPDTVHELDDAQRDALAMLLMEPASLAELARSGVAAITLDYLVACRLVLTDRRYRRVQVSDTGVRALRAADPTRLHAIMAVVNGEAGILDRRRTAAPAGKAPDRFTAAAADLAADGVTFVLDTGTGQGGSSSAGDQGDSWTHAVAKHGPMIAHTFLPGAFWVGDTLRARGDHGYEFAPATLYVSFPIGRDDVANAIVKAFTGAGYTTTWTGDPHDTVEIHLT